MPISIIRRLYALSPSIFVTTTVLPTFASPKVIAWRLQGGGFAGTIQAFVPLALLETYKNAIDAVFGAGSCHVLSVRNYGAVMVTPDM